MGEARGEGAAGRIVVAVALEAEVALLRRRARIEARSGPELCLLVTGIGPRRAYAAARAFCAERPALVLAVGFCAGLAADLRPGDIVLAEEALDRTRPKADRTVFASDPKALAAALRAPPPEGDPSRLRAGRIATVDRLLPTPGVKEDLARQTGAVAADMESAAVLRAAAEKNVPALAVRAVLDELEWAVPERALRLVDGRGKPRVGALVAMAFAPGGPTVLWGLARRSRIAQRNLTSFLEAYLEDPGLAALQEDKPRHDS